MPALAETILTPEEEELGHKRATLAAFEAELADRELELATCRSELIHFEKRYLQSVGRRYATLDDLKAQIAEARARQHPSKQDARDQARQARAQAEESARAMGDGTPDAQTDADPSAKSTQSETLKKLFRQAARLLHPDLTLDGGEKERRHHLMAEVNDAFSRGDEERIRAILREWHASPENVQGDGPGAELIRVIRKIAQVQKRLKTITADLEQLRQGELFKLKQQVDEAQTNGRDLLKDLAARLDSEIRQARDELKRSGTTGVA